MDPQKTRGELAIIGDWACVHGELAALGDVARRISQSVGEPLHCELVAFADMCLADPKRASDQWTSVRERLFRVTR